MFTHGMSKWLRSPSLPGLALAVGVIGLWAATGFAQPTPGPTPDPSRKASPRPSPKKADKGKPSPGAEKRSGKEKETKPGTEKGTGPRAEGGARPGADKKAKPGAAQERKPAPAEKPKPAAGEEPKPDADKEPQPGAEKEPTPGADKKPEPIADRKPEPRADRKRDDSDEEPIEVPPDVQEKLDRLMDRQRTKGSEPPSRPAAGPAKDRVRHPAKLKEESEKDTENRRESDRQTPRERPRLPGAEDRERGSAPEATTPINIPSTEVDVPAEERTYWFSIKDGTYEQLLEGVNRQTGMAILGDAPRDGKVTFITEEALTFDQMLARVRMLLFKYKPHEPYWLLKKETHLEAIRVNDIYRILPPELMFRSVEEYRAANLSEDELALVIYTPKSGSVARLKAIRDFMPDYVRIAPLEDRNAVTIFALVQDIEKYLRLIPIFVEGPTGDDPRTLEIIQVNHIAPTDAWTKIQTLMEVDGSSARARPSGSKRGRESGLLETMPEPEVSVVPDDAQGVLIVRAMQDKIEEIKLLLPLIDVDSRWPEKFEVIELQYVAAEDMVPMIEQILAASGGAGVPASSSRPRGRKRRSKATPARETGDITLLPHPAGNAIIVVADEEDVAQVRHLVSIFDKEGVIGPIHIEVRYADTTELVGMVTQVLLGAGGAKKPADQRFRLVEGPTGDGIWYTGNKRDLDKVREVIEAIDQPEGEVTLHVKRLEHRAPSFVADMLMQYESAGAAGAKPGAPTGRKRKKASRSGGGLTAKGKFTPDDEEKRLYVLCTEEEWEEYLEIIEQLEAEVEESQPFVLIAVNHIAPEEAIGRLTALMSGTSERKKPGKGGAIQYEPTDNAIVVTGATGEEIEHMREILAVFDTPPAEIVQRTFEIRHADPEDIIAAIQALVIASPDRGVGKRRGGKREPKAPTPGTVGSADVTIVPMGDRLVVRAALEEMEQIAAIIDEFDTPEEATTLRVYEDFPPSADLTQIAETLKTLLVGRPPVQKGKRKREATAPGGPQIVPHPAAGKLIVIAEPAEFAEIEELLDVLRSEIVAPTYDTAFVDVEFADAGDVVELVEPVLSMKVQELVAQGTLKGEAAPVVADAKGKKAGKGRPSATREWFHIEADVRNARVVIVAPQVVIDQATALVGEFDRPIDTEEPVVWTIELEKATATDMVKTIREMVGVRPGRVPARGRTPDKTAGEPSDVEFSIVEAPGDRAVVLRGIPELVEEAAAWIAELDVISVSGRQIKIYEIEYADIKTLVNLIVATVDVPAPTAKVGKRPRPRGGSKALEFEEEDEWTTEIKHVGTEVYVQADLIAKTMIVSTTASKMGQIDKLVAELNREGELPSAPVVPTFTYQLEHVDALEAEFALEEVVKAFWGTDEDLPRVDAAIWANDILVIGFPDESRFDEIKELIVEYVDKPSGEEDEPVRKAFVAPEGMSASEVALWFQMNNPGIQFELTNVSERSEKDFGVERIGPGGQATRCVLPGAFGRMSETLSAAALALRQDAGDDDPPPDDEDDEPLPDEVGDDDPPLDEIGEDEPLLDEVGDDEPLPDEVDQADEAEDVLQQFSRSLLNGGEQEVEPRASEATERGAKARPRAAGEGVPKKVTVLYNPETGAVIVEGDRDSIRDVESSFDELKEETQKFLKPPDIRIYRVKYISVYSAAAIIEEMFNATRQQRAMMQQQQRRAQQLARRQQLQQQRRQQQQEGGKQQPGQQGQAGRRGQRGQQPQQLQMQQLPATTVRVYPNPRDRSLILRADPSQYPALEELLATIDQPQPIESRFRTYALEKLNAVEVEELLNDMLGLDEPAQGARRRQTSRAAGARRGAPSSPSIEPGGQLPQTIVQRMTTSENVLGVDPQDIQISSNEEANTILAMAPEAALDYIGELIEQLESYDVPERIWKSYQLHFAQVDDVVEYLEGYFDEGSSAGTSGRKASTRGGRRGGKVGQASTTPRALNAPTFVSYSRLNLLSAQAVAEQIEEIDKLIERLDVQGDEGEWQTITLARADAQDVADTLTEMFSTTTTSGTRRRQPRRGKSPTTATAATGPRFIGEEGGRVVFYSAPERLREDILATVERLEAQAQDPRPRIIQLVHARPSDVAETIESAFGGGTRPSGSRGRTRGGSSGTTRFSVTADDPSKRLFVIADDETFAQIESVAQLMDVDRGIGVDFRIYPLQYADAKKVHEQMSKLLTDYLRRLGRGSEGVEPFSVEVDEKANALIVLGSPAVFGFLEENLEKIDNPANKRSPPTVLIFTLKNANAQEIAQSINRLWGGRRMQTGENPPQAEASRATNTLIVRGTEDQCEEIKKEFIDPLEEQTPPRLFAETFELKFAQPEAVAESVNRVFQDKADAYRRLGRDTNVSPLEFTVIATADVNTKHVIVQASQENMELVRERIKELDREDRAIGSAIRMEVYPVKFADPNGVVRIITDWARSRSTSGGRTRSVAASDVVTATAEPATQSVVVTASESNHLIIHELIESLDDESLATGLRKQHVIMLKFANSNELAQQLTQVFRNAGTLRRGDRGPTFVSNATSNALVATVNEQELAELQELIATLDVEPSLDAQRVTEVYSLQYADPGSLNAVVLNMFRWDRRGQASPSEQVTSAIEWGGRALIVTANVKNHEIVKKMIEKADVESAVAKENHVYQLKVANAESVARTLQEAYRGRRRTGRGEEPVQITADPGTNSLIILATKAEMAELEMLIHPLDVEPDLNLGQQVRTFALKNADPWVAQDAITKLFRGGGRGQSDQMSAVADFNSNSVTVSASGANMKRVEAFVAEMESASDGGRQEVHVIDLQNAEAEAVSRTLNDIFVRSQQRRGGGEVPISISALMGSKAILVKCAPDDFAEIQAAVTELDSDTTVLGEEVRVVTLLHTDATEVQTSMQEYLRKPGGRGGRGADLAGDVRLSVLTQTNAVIVSGEKNRVDLIEMLIQEMDQAGEKSSVPQIIVLEHASVMNVLPSIEEMFEQARGGRGRGQQPPTIVANDALNALVVRGSQTDVAAIEAIVEQLDNPTVAQQPNFKLIPVSAGVNVTELAEMIEEAVNESVAAQMPSGRRGEIPSITVIPDSRRNLLTVSGSPRLFAQAEELASAYENLAPSTGAGIKIITLGKTPASEVTQLIEQLKGESSGGRGRASRGRSSGRRSSARGGSSQRGGSRRRP